MELYFMQYIPKHFQTPTVDLQLLLFAASQRHCPGYGTPLLGVDPTNTVPCFPIAAGPVTHLHYQGLICTPLGRIFVEDNVVTLKEALMVPLISLPTLGGP